MNRFLILTLLLLTALSCSKEQTGSTVQEQEQRFAIAAVLPSTETRVSSNTDNDESWTFSWEKGDSLGSWCTSCTTLNKFTNSAESGEDGYFEGAKLETDESYRFIFPYEKSVTFDGSSTLYPIDISQQDGTLNKTYFINDKLYKTEDLTTLTMEYVGGFMAVGVYLENYNSNYTYTLKSVEYNNVPTTANIDLTEDYNSETICSVTTPKGTITTTLSEPFAKATYNEIEYLKATAKLNIIPFSVTAEENMSVSITIEVENGTNVTEFTSEITFSNETEISFDRATHNFTNLKVSAEDGIEITGATINDWGEEVDNGKLQLSPTYTASEIDADNIPEKNTWEITDSGEITQELMSGVREAIATSYEKGQSIKIILPNATSIGPNSFYYENSNNQKNCLALTEIEMPNVTSIGKNAFYYCGFTSFDFEGVTEIGEGAFVDCVNLTEVTNFNFTTIPDCLFGHCGFTTFDFEGVTEVGEGAFISCTSLAEVINFNFTTIPYYLFAGCGFTTFDFEGVTEIGEGAFFNCGKLVNIELPSSVTSIGVDAFSYTGYLNLTLNWSGDEILDYNEDVFDSDLFNNVYIPAGTKDDYKAKNWVGDWLTEKEN